MSNPKTRITGIELVPRTNLKQHPKNPNKHSPEQIERLAQIIEYQGWRYPIKVSRLSGFVTSGNGRLQAADLRGWTHVPVSYQEYESAEQEYADLVADNSIAEWSDLDLGSVNSEIGEFGPDFDIDLLGIKGFVIEPADKGQPGCDEDEVPENIETICKLDDIWQLGRHRLMCSDSTNIDAIEKLMDGERAEITFTSPPYNLNKSSLNLRNGIFSEKDQAYINDNDQRSEEEYLSLLSITLSTAMLVSDYQIFNLQMLTSNKIALARWIGSYAENLVDIYIWNKTNPQPAMAERVATSAFEFFLIFSKNNRPKRSVNTSIFARGTFSNVFNHAVGNNSHTNGMHGATFPISLAEHYISNLSKSLVLDIFGGSGSTLIACEKTNRKCFMMEIDPHYCDVIIARWQKYTGRKAELQTSGPVEQPLA